MKILIAEDDATSRRLLEVSLAEKGYEVVIATDGNDALTQLTHPNDTSRPQLAILDWMMPGRDGVDVCRALRERADGPYVYIILVTTKSTAEDVIEGLEAGADDYIRKPFDPHELAGRVATGARVLNLQTELAGKLHELQHALSLVKQLQGLLPICMYCKKIRDEGDTWQRLETFIERNSEAMFSHSLCEDCREEHYPALSATLG